MTDRDRIVTLAGLIKDAIERDDLDAALNYANEQRVLISTAAIRRKLSLKVGHDLGRPQ
jgi:hypothetical protein